MKTLISASIFAIGIIIGSSAYAADMAVKAPPPAPAPYVAYNWTGFYVGGEIGGGWATSQLTVVNNFTSFKPAFPPGTVDRSIDFSGILGGFYGGYNYQINQFVVGVDGDITWADLTGTGQDVSVVNGDVAHHNDVIDRIATVTGRLGYAWDNWLLFAKGGWAWARFSGSTNVVSPAGAVTALDVNGGDDRNGWTVGGGIEWGFSQHVSFKLEYDFVKFDTANFNIAATSFAHGVAGTFARSATSDLNMIKGGIAYRF